MILYDRITGEEIQSKEDEVNIGKVRKEEW